MSWQQIYRNLVWHFLLLIFLCWKSYFQFINTKHSNSCICHNSRGRMERMHDRQWISHMELRSISKLSHTCDHSHSTGDKQKHLIPRKRLTLLVKQQSPTHQGTPQQISTGNQYVRVIPTVISHNIILCCGHNQWLAENCCSNARSAVFSLCMKQQIFSSS